jgi:hypothetical protein
VPITLLRLHNNLKCEEIKMIKEILKISLGVIVAMAIVNVLPASVQKFVK